MCDESTGCKLYEIDFLFYVCIQRVLYSNGRSLGYVLWMSPPCHFYSIPHSETRPFSIQPLFNHSYTRLLWHSDPHCIYKSLASYLIYSRFIGQFSTVKGHIYKSKTFYLICSRFNGHRRMAELERPRRVHERLRGSSRITHEKITWSGNYSNKSNSGHSNPVWISDVFAPFLKYFISHPSYHVSSSSKNWQGKFCFW